MFTGREERRLPLFGRYRHCGLKGAVKRRVEAVRALKLLRDRLHERIFLKGLDHPPSRLLNHGEEFGRREALLVGERHPKEQLLIGLMDLIEMHGGSLHPARAPCLTFGYLAGRLVP